MTTDTTTAVRIEFGKVGDARPIPDLILNEPEPNAFNRAVTEHALPYLRPVLAALGRPELADCVFVPTQERTAGFFLAVDLVGGEGARFCGVRITPMREQAAAGSAAAGDQR
jgi:hypothetical protein